MDKFSPTHFGKMVWFLTADTGLAISWALLWLMLGSTTTAGKLCVNIMPHLMSSRGCHSHTFCTTICDRGQTQSQGSSIKNPASQRTNNVCEGPLGQQSMRQKKTTIDTFVVYGVLRVSLLRVDHVRVPWFWEMYMRSRFKR